MCSTLGRATDMDGCVRACELRVRVMCLASSASDRCLDRGEAKMSSEMQEKNRTQACLSFSYYSCLTASSICSWAVQVISHRITRRMAYIFLLFVRTFCIFL